MDINESVDSKLPKFAQIQNGKHTANNNYLKYQSSSRVPHFQKGHPVQVVLKTGFTKLPRGSAIDQTFVSPTPPRKFALKPNLQRVGDGALGGSWDIRALTPEPSWIGLVIL